MLCIPCLRLATEQHCTLPQNGLNGNGNLYLIIHELETHTLAEVDEELLRGVRGLVGGFPYCIKASNKKK